MSILIDETIRVIVQGITGQAGSRHTGFMLQAGTNIVAGVTPGKGGQFVEGVPVYDTVEEARRAQGANVSIVFVPAPMAADAILESFEAKMDLVVCITEGIPVLDMIRLRALTGGSKTVLVGPNCPGIMAPGKALLGIMPADIFRCGGIGIVSRSGTLTYEIVDALSRANLGQSICVGIGGDPVHGLKAIDCLRLFEKDEETEKIILIGEIGGTEEEEAASYHASMMSKPMVALVAGRLAPEGRRMGHAGAIISMGGGSAQAKIRAFEQAGVPVCRSIRQITETVSSL